MEVDEVKEDEKDKEKKEKEEKEKKEEKKPEPPFEILQNPARVMKSQLKVISLVEGSAYQPLKDITIGGIVMVRHTKGGSEEQLVEPVAAFGPKPDEEKEPEPPEPFEYTED
uniref:26S proteasome regulatory subunit RPN2 C-terminal domain-containing protein n=6 Tax=Cicadellinae TaxID=33370 RepID=A0A1B6JD15_9HEMI